MDAKRVAIWILGGLVLLEVLKESGLADSSDSEDQTGSLIDQLPSISDAVNMVSDGINTVDEQQKQDNLDAFLEMLKYAEGTRSDEGYKALFGWRPGNGKTFDSYNDHPRIMFDYKDLSGKVIQTSAAGAYQITRTTFDGLRKQHPEFVGRGFYPDTQDDMAIQLIKDKGALADVQAGRLSVAINKLRKIWASLPNSDVNQPTRTYQACAKVFEEEGGVIA